MMPELEKAVLAEMDEAKRKAIDSLGRYKFAMFGYWAGIWVHLNRLSGLKQKNPFSFLVAQARAAAVNAKDSQC